MQQQSQPSASGSQSSATTTTTTAEAGLPDAYDSAALEAWCNRRPGEMNLRWANFLRLTVPFMARVGASFSTGNIEKDEVVLAREMCSLLSQLGPTFVKLGQLVSSRSDLVSPGVAEELGRLQSNVAPFRDDAAIQAIEAELGKPLSAVFEEFHPRAAAAASLAQVYKGRLHTGEDVAVKIQRPEALPTVARDLVILRRGLDYYKGTIFLLLRELGAQSASFTPETMEELLHTWASGFYEELNFASEAKTQAEFREALLEGVDGCYVPAVHRGLCSRRLLVSEWVDGRKITDCGPEEVRRLLDVGANCFVFQLLEFGRFHADPHAGNMMRLDCGRLCLIDFGLVAEIPYEARPAIAGSIVHLANCNWPKYVDALVRLGVLDDDKIDRPQVEDLSERLLRPFVTRTGPAAEVVQQLDPRQLAADLAESADIPVETPSYFALLSRAVSILEGVALSNDPNYSLLWASAPLAAAWLIRAEEEGFDQEEEEEESHYVLGDNSPSPSSPSSSKEGLPHGTRRPSSGQDLAVELLLSETATPTRETASLARWLLTADSSAARASLEKLLQHSAAPEGSPASPGPSGPMRLLEVAKVATSFDDADAPSGAPDGRVPHVQRALRFLLQSTAPRVQEEVVAQAAHAFDLCSRYIMRGQSSGGVDGGAAAAAAAAASEARDRVPRTTRESAPLVMGFVPMMGNPSDPGGLNGLLRAVPGSDIAKDLIFPPLTEAETEQAQRLFVVAINTFGVKDTEELQELLVPWGVLKALRDGSPIQAMQQFMDTVSVGGGGPQASSTVHQAVLAQMQHTYASRVFGLGDLPSRMLGLDDLQQR